MGYRERNERVASFRYDQFPGYKSREYFDRYDPLSPEFQPIRLRAKPSDIVDSNPILESRSSLLQAHAAQVAEGNGYLERRFFTELV